MSRDSFGAALFALLLLAAPARAQERDADYRRAIEGAVAELGAGRHAEALALFREAHRIAPSARTLRGIAMASFEMNDYVEAVRYARRALASEARPLDADLRARTERLLARASAFVARYTLELEPPDAIVRLDGVQIELEEGATLLVGLGRHRVRAEAPGREPAEEVVVVRGGEQERFALRLLEPPDPPEPVVEPPPPEVSPARPPPASDHTAAHALIVAGAITVGGSIPAWAWAADRVDAVGACRDVCDNRDRLRTQRDAALGVSIAASGLGIALAVIGLALWLDSGEASTAHACRATTDGLICRGDWL